VPTVFILAGEESGDLLGANLMRSLNDRLGGRVRFLGVGGSRLLELPAVRGPDGAPKLGQSRAALESRPSARLH